MNVLMQVLTLFLLMLCGLMAVKIRLLDEKGLQGLNAFVLNFALPAMILRRLQTPASPDLISQLLWVFVLGCVTMGLAGLGAYFLFRKEPAKRRAVLTNLSMASNCAFMGYPVLTAALGEEALIYAVMYVAAFNLMCWTLGAWFFGGKGAMQPKRLLTNPSLLAVFGGAILFLTGWTLPSFLNNALDMLGSTNTPVAMFVIGARLISLRREHLADTKLLLACALRLMIFPVMLLVLRLTPLSDMAVNVLFLCTAMPGAALTAMQSEAFGSDRELASRGVALSTALSMATIPLMLLLI